MKTATNRPDRAPLWRAVCLLIGSAALLGAAHAAPLLGVKIRPACRGLPDDVQAFSSWLGRDVQLALDFLGDRSIQEWSNIGWWARCWGQLGGDVVPVLSVPLLPRSGGATLEKGAEGAYDAIFTGMAQTLKNQGVRRAIIRLGWEFNGDWYPWRAQGKEEAWKRYWARAVQAMRKVDGIELRFDWCPNIGEQKVSPEKLYPGDEHVDIIGMDVYNVGRASDPLPARWRHLMDMPFGLRWHAAFAASRGKKMSYPEWGTGINSQGTGGGDDPHYVCAMAAWMKQLGERLSYQAYWNEKASFDAQLDSGGLPLAAQAYRAEFGPGASSESSAFCKGVLGGAP